MPKEKRFILKNIHYENRLLFHRLAIAWFLMLVGLAFIVGRLYYLQVTKHREYTTLSEDNRIKVLPLPPKRGLIYDRNGVLLAGNQASYTLEVIAEKMGDIDKTLAELGQVITITEEDIKRFKKQLRQKRKFEAVPLRFRLTEAERAQFYVQRHRFPGMDVTSSLSRYYPLGATGVHIVGYVGRINQRELKIIDRTNYKGTDYIGKTGIEKYYEKTLHGTTGSQEVEVNVQGRILRILGRKPPIAGKNLYLNIDISLQNFIEQLVKDERAAVVAIEPPTGAVLALVSMPSYDPNLFVTGIDVESYHALRDSPDRPLFNRAIRGQYPPGSTIKPFVGLAGLEYNIRTPYSTTWCPGWYRLKDQPHLYRDWKRSGHGHMNLHHAIEQSCDVYFYDLAHDLGIDRLHNFMTRFSFGRKTGIDMNGELSGLMPSRKWKNRRRNKPWYPGETLITGIGQGFMLSTPLQLAVATATLSMHGQFKAPRVVFAVDDTSTHEMSVISSMPRSTVVLREDSFWDEAIEGMKAVIYGRRGTARKLRINSPYRFAGKTGTAQVFSIKQDEHYDAKRLAKRLHDHAWFIAFAPLENPKIAVSVIVENGGSGSRTAAPLAKQVMDYYLVQDSPLRENYPPIEVTQ